MGWVGLGWGGRGRGAGRWMDGWMVRGGSWVRVRVEQGFFGCDVIGFTCLTAYA